MKEYKLGRMPGRKTFKIDQKGNISIESKVFGSGEYNTKDFKMVYISKPRFMVNGEMYLSISGDKHDGNVLGKITGFNYTKKQENDIKKIIKLMKEANKALEIEEFTASMDDLGIGDRNTIKCPKCNSKNVVFLDNKKKSFSMGKAVAGGVLTGGIGTLAGFAGKKGKDRWHCQDCGNMFKRKP